MKINVVGVETPNLQLIVSLSADYLKFYVRKAYRNDLAT